MATLTMSLLDDMRNARSQIGEWAKSQKQAIDQMEAEHAGALKACRGKSLTSCRRRAR